MSVILVPWRPSTPSRTKVWEQLQAHLQDLGLPVVTGDSDPRYPFNRSEARNVAAERAGDWDVALFLDADTFIPSEQVDFALELARAEETVVYPYLKFKSMNPITGEARERVQNEGNFPHSGNVAVSRQVYEASGGWDERLRKWGWEDGAFLTVARALCEPACAWGTAVSIEHGRTLDERPEAVLAAGARPALLDGYADIEATIAAVRQARLNRWVRP